MKTTRIIIRRILSVTVLIGLSHGLCGCGDHVRLPSTEKLALFENAGPSGPTVDMNRTSRASVVRGPYRVQVNDVLELRLPTFLYPNVAQRGTADNATSAQLCRVGDGGMITLPHGRQIYAAGRTLTQIEAEIVDTFYPELVKTRPSIYVQVADYATSRVRIMGAVAEPGLYELRYDQMSLVALLMEAGGIIQDGAAVIRITHSEQTDARPEVGSDADSSQPDTLSWLEAASDRRRSDRLLQEAGQTATAYLCFEHEGALDTTGWLSVTRDGKVVFREWLDIGIRRQRWTTLSKLDAVVKIRRVTETDMRIAGLARLLGVRPRGNLAHLAAYQGNEDWSERGRDVFVTSLDVAEDQSATDPDPVPPPADAGRESTVVLPVKGVNIPFADVVLREGDTVVVERPKVQYVSVLGLVRSPGNFPYPPNAEFTLAEALAFAGGLDLVADPRFVCVYRLQADGTVASAAFRLVNPKKNEQFTAAMALPLKRGDVVSVENTPRTRTNTFFDRVFRVSLGLYLNPDTIWNN